MFSSTVLWLINWYFIFLLAAPLFSVFCANSSGVLFLGYVLIICPHLMSFNSMINLSRKIMFHHDTIPFISILWERFVYFHIKTITISVPYRCFLFLVFHIYWKYDVLHVGSMTQLAKCRNRHRIGRYLH